MNVSDTCNAAADLIEVRGWKHGPSGWLGTGGPLCVEGALMAATGLQRQATLRCSAYQAVRDYLGIDGPLFVWNDVQPLKFLSDNPHAIGSPEALEWAREQVIATLRAVAVIHAAREDESVETRTVEAVAR